MDSRIFKKRIRTIRKKLSDKNIDTLIITTSANVTYTTGFSGSDSWAVVTKRAVYLLTDSRYTQQAQIESANCQVIERTGSLSQAVGKLLQQLSSVKTPAVEESISIAELKALKKHAQMRLKTVAGFVESVRTVKDAGEIATVKKAAQIAAAALKKISRFIKPGITETELAGRLDFEIRKFGATNSFETIVAFGPNASMPHYQPGKKKLKQNDTILIDFGAKYKGYCCDITRCFTVGRVTNFYRKVYDVVKQAQAAAIKTVKAGVKMADIDAAARCVIEAGNLPVYGHGTGHGLGLEVHEDPIVTAKAKEKLQAGQIITIEPGIYIPGKLGIRIEDDILVTKAGCKVLTANCP